MKQQYEQSEVVYLKFLNERNSGIFDIGKSLLCRTYRKWRKTLLWIRYHNKIYCPPILTNFCFGKPGQYTTYFL
jgi:hypothetical protein